jgi:alpha-ribazole phosphatase
MRLWLARHAAVPGSAGLCYGASDLAADTEQTTAAAHQLARALPSLTQAWCSPLQRCRALAECLQPLRPGLSITIDARLAEMDFGNWEGRTWDAIGEPQLSAWTDNFAQHQPGGGESVAQFMRRVDAALQSLAAHPGSDGLWITHAGVIKAARLLVRGQHLVTQASQWPIESVACGQWTVLDLPFSAATPGAPGSPQARPDCPAPTQRGEGPLT